MTARHLNITLDLALVDLFKGAQNAPDFLKLNPNHCVPLLEHNGFVLWESYAIMQYLAELTPHQTLYPAAPQDRADVNRWLFWCGQNFMPGTSILSWENANKALAGIGAPDPVEVARGELLLTEAACVLDTHLAGQEWLCRTGLSLADFAISAPLIDQERARFPIMELPNLQRWLRQVQALDAWVGTAY